MQFREVSVRDSGWAHPLDALREVAAAFRRSSGREMIVDLPSILGVGVEELVREDKKEVIVVRSDEESDSDPGEETEESDNSISPESQRIIEEYVLSRGEGTENPLAEIEARLGYY